MDLSKAEVAEKLNHRRPGFTLEAPFYTSREIFELDVALIFRRHWIFVAVEPEIPEPGDYVTVDVGRNSVFVLRDEALQVRAFHNVCRHRGARILNEPRGFVGNIVCPYHQWTYALDGGLIHAENPPACLEQGEYGLKPVHVRSLVGLIFICLADEPPLDFDSMAAAVAPYLEVYQLQNCKIARQIDLIERGNWKLTMENNRECYHCGNHPELTRSMFSFFGYKPNGMSATELAEFERFKAAEAGFISTWRELELPWQAVELLDERATAFRVERLPLAGEGESYTMDTKVASKRLLGELTQKRLGLTHLHVQPNCWHHFLSDHVVTFSVLPVAPDQTLVRTTWLVHKDAVEGQDYTDENLTHVWKMTNEQDKKFVEYAQRGVASDAYEPGPYAPTEYMVDRFCSWYTQELGKELVC